MTEAKSKTNKSTSNAHQRPRDAATLIIVDGAETTPRVLMGKRRGDVAFMPNKFVFPGGRVDSADRDVTSLDELADSEVQKLLHDMKGHPSAARARAIALAGIREVFEETGMIIGEKGASHAATDVAGWTDFFASGYLPKLSHLCFFARAITPPGRPRRYDTRFFCIQQKHIALDTDRQDEELSEIAWYGLEESTQLDLPPITRVILEDLSDQLAAGPLGPSRNAVPYYHQRHGTFFRELISIEGG